MLLSNPLAHPFLVPLGWTFAALFGSSLVALLLTVHGHWQVLSASVLFQRWRTWLLIAPLFSLVVLAGPLAIALFAMAAGLQGTREYARLTDLSRGDRAVLFAAAIALPLVALLRHPSTSLSTWWCCRCSQACPRCCARMSNTAPDAPRRSSLACGICLRRWP